VPAPGPEAATAARDPASAEAADCTAAAARVIERNSAQVEQYRGGKAQIFGFLVGQLMKEMRGKANAEVANAVMRELLDAG